jgi:hypothetical protein
MECTKCYATAYRGETHCNYCGEPTGERRLRDVTCPQCEREFPLLWNDYSHIRPQQKQTLFIRGCPSGGIYSVSIHCPHCDYEEEL